MGFRSVAPEPREPQPAVPLRWVAAATAAFVLLPFLPAAFALLFGTVTVLETRLVDAPRSEVVVREPIPEVVAAEIATAEREAERAEARARLEQRRYEREAEAIEEALAPVDESPTE